MDKINRMNRRDETERVESSQKVIVGCESDYIIGLTNCEPLVTVHGTDRPLTIFIVDLYHHAVWSRHWHRTGKGTRGIDFFHSEFDITHSSLQCAIQDELIKRGYSAEPGPFLAAFEYQETANRRLQTRSWQNTSLL